MTMLVVVAIAEDDGWAFVRTGDEWFVCRPPYREWSKTKVTADRVELGIAHHGFVHADMHFQDWNELIRHLKQVQVAAWKKRGGETFSGQEIGGLVHHMPAERLAEFLDRVEEDLFPYARWAAAQNLLTTLLKVETVRQNKDLHGRTVSLLEQCLEKLKSVQDVANLIDSNAAFKQRFSRVSGTVDSQEVRNYAKARARTGHIFA